MKPALRHVLVFVLAAAMLGFGAASLGLVSIAASAAHWPPAKWFLHYTMRRSVTMQARNIETPSDLADERRVRLGAGAYAYQCASCHGAPGQRAELVGSLMIPPAPSLPEVVVKWKPRELFWIVKHGIKYTAMPAWATQAHDDEIWAVVAFLLQLPRMSAGHYRELAFGAAGADTDTNTEDVLTGFAMCAGCHGLDGAGREGSAPNLAGQSAAYLATSLRDYAAGQRPSGVMQPLASAMSAQEIAALSAAFAAMPKVRRDLARLDPQALAPVRGAQIADLGVPARDVAACASCHGDSARGVQPRFPALDGQNPEYLAIQLRLFRDGKRAATPSAALMRAAIGQLSDEDIRAVALFYSVASRAPLRAANLDADADASR